MADYVTLAELKASLSITDNADDTALNRALTFASRSVDKHCHRPHGFGQDSGVSARTYRAEEWRRLIVDDISTLTGLLVTTDDNDDGAFETSWTVTTDFLAAPLNNLADSRPVTRLEAVGFRSFPRGRHPGVQVTARWGWPAVPDEVRAATLIHAAHLYRRKDTPDGVAGIQEFGAIRISRFKDPDVVMLLADFVRPAGMVG